MESFRIGAQLYSVRQFCQTESDFAQTMGRIAATGWRGVQISAIGPLDPAFVRKVCDDHGLSIICTHVSFDDMLSNFEAVVEKHRIYGCIYPGLGSMPRHYYDHGLDSLDVFIHEISDLARRFENAGMHLLYHNHAQEFQKYDGELLLSRMMRECNPALQFELDTYWIQCGGGDPIQWLHGRSADVIHFKDMIGTIDNTPMITAIGQGNLNWPGIIQACRETQVQWAMIEQDNADQFGDPVDQLAKSFEYLTELGCRP